jgi:hypothetical protein
MAPVCEKLAKRKKNFIDELREFSWLDFSVLKTKIELDATRLFGSIIQTVNSRLNLE